LVVGNDGGLERFHGRQDDPGASIRQPRGFVGAGVGIKRVATSSPMLESGRATLSRGWHSALMPIANSTVVQSRGVHDGIFPTRFGSAKSSAPR
jgi:hypothetical protein